MPKQKHPNVQQDASNCNNQKNEDDALRDYLFPARELSHAQIGAIDLMLHGLCDAQSEKAVRAVVDAPKPKRARAPKPHVKNMPAYIAAAARELRDRHLEQLLVLPNTKYDVSWQI